MLIVLNHPPSSNKIFYDQFKNLLKSCDLRKEILLMGDPNVNWEDKTMSKTLRQVTYSFDLCQVVKGSTRITNTTATKIYLIFSNKPERIKSLNMVIGYPTIT